MSTTTAAATEISSNSNSSCRLLDCLNSLPFHDQLAFRNLFSYIDFVRLSACSRSLKSSIRNDRALWQELYQRDFLSKDCYDKEMEFVLWCIRTDVNNPCTSDKRADLLENVDWYNTYRRRVIIENNRRYGRCKTTHIDMEKGKTGVWYHNYVHDYRIIIAEQGRSNETPVHYYILEYLPHSNLKSSNNTVYESTFSTLPNIHSLDTGNEDEYDYILSDHYIAVSPKAIRNNTDYNVRILSRKQGGVFTTFDIPTRYKVDTIKGKWILLVHESKKRFADSPIYKLNVMVFDIDNNIMCPGNIDDTWDATYFYKTTNDTAIVYTARIVEEEEDDDGVDRIEWALYQFSSNNPVEQLRNGWFQLPKEITDMKLYACNSYGSHMIIGFPSQHNCHPYIIHSVASSGQSHTPRNCYNITDQRIPIPLLRAGLENLIFNSNLAKVWTDISFNDDQVLQIPDTVSIRHIIGDLYEFLTWGCNHKYNILLVDISTKEIIREFETPDKKWDYRMYAMLGMLCCSYGMRIQRIVEYGEI